MLRLVLLCLLLTPPALACAPPHPTEVEIHLARVNSERAKQGRRPLTLAPDLSQVAQAHACDMTRRGYFSHTSPNGRGMMDRMRAAGLSQYCTVGENIAQGQRDVPTVMDGWMRSSGHRRNILAADFTHIGFGTSGPHWVQLFGGAC